MKAEASRALVVALADRLRQHGSWCGETHIQKTAYFLQELWQVPLGYDFILYKHGPYSFDLTDDITMLRADKVLEAEPAPPYGRKIVRGLHAEELLQEYAEVINQYDSQLEEAALILGYKRVVELEQLGTALLVKKQMPEAEFELRARKLHELKPHVPLEDARLAVEEVDQYVAQYLN